MFALLALICFLLALFGAAVGTINLVILGWVFISLALLVGNWPVATVMTKYRDQP